MSRAAKAGVSGAEIRRLGPGDRDAAQALAKLFRLAFDGTQAEDAAAADDAWLEDLLGQRRIIILVAARGARIAGGLVAHLLPKLDRRQTELYLYDLAVAEGDRRQGIATALVCALGPIARAEGATALYVQADRDDAPAIALYRALGRGAPVLHFDLDLDADARD